MPEPYTRVEASIRSFSQCRIYIYIAQFGLLICIRDNQENPYHLQVNEFLALKIIISKFKS